MRNLGALVTLIGLALFGAPIASAGEISVLSGGYKSESSKQNGQDGGGRTEISLGGRYMEPLSEFTHWFVGGELTMRSFEAGEGQKAPSNATGLALGGGVRVYFPEFSQLIIPYASGFAGYLMDKDGHSGTEPTETEVSGLFYGASVGFRFDVERDMFFELEGNLFTSSLFMTTISRTGDEKEEKTTTELFAKSQRSLTDPGVVTFAIGMRL